MKNIIICNLANGNLGRSSIFAKKPTFYLGQTSLCNLYFEDYPSGGYTGAAPDGYASGISNVNKDSASLAVKISAGRGQTPIVTQSTWANLSPTVAIVQSFAHHQIVFSFEPTPIKGYYTLTLTGAANLPPSTEYPSGASIPSLAAYAHTVFRDTTSAKLYAETGEGDIEDAIKAMFREIVSGVASSIFQAGNGLGGVPYSSSNPGLWQGYTLRAGSVSPIVQAANVRDSEWNLTCYCPDFELELLHNFVSKANALVGAPNSADAATEWSKVVATAKGMIDLSNIVVTNVSLEGPRGKTGTLDFSDAQFTTLMGSSVEKELWLECVLTEGSAHTVAEGPILLKKPSP